MEKIDDVFPNFSAGVHFWSFLVQKEDKFVMYEFDSHGISDKHTTLSNRYYCRSSVSFHKS